MNTEKIFYLATRGSALALAQANMILDRCRAAFPGRTFELKIIKTTGDKLQTASLAQENKSLPKGLFTKELEIALIEGAADLAVHSLKDLPTDLPPGLKLGGVGGPRENVRDVLVYRGTELNETGAASSRGFPAGLAVRDLPTGAVVATSSTRRKAQLLTQNPGLRLPDIRGNVLTRLQKLADNPEIDATVLALAGMTRLHYIVRLDGRLEGPGVPPGLRATVLEPDIMLPCVGQGAIGIEIRDNDPETAAVCEKLNHSATLQAVIAERAFLRGMGGGCQSPVGAYAEPEKDQLRMRVVSFLQNKVQRAEARRPMVEAERLGAELAAGLQN